MNLIINFVIALMLAAGPGCGKKEVKNESIIPHSIAKGFKTEVFVSNLEVPWSIIFTSAERILVNERPGRVRVIESGTLNLQPVLTLNDVSSDSEEGLMGLVLDPEYNNNKFNIYAKSKIIICFRLINIQ